MATKTSEFSHGLIAGGLLDGSIHIWDPSKLISNEKMTPEASVEQHNKAVHGLQFNPHRESSHLLASGGADGEVFILDVGKPSHPNVFIPSPPPNTTKHTAEITRVAWNTQVAHIVASSSQNGSCIVWDLRQKKPWFVNKI